MENGQLTKKRARRHCFCVFGGVLKWGEKHTICKHNYHLKYSNICHWQAFHPQSCLLFLTPTHLSRLESGWEAPCPPLLPLPPVPDEEPPPPPEPADCRFPDSSFSTAARFPVRAASRSSCSFPMANPTEKREAGKGGFLGCRKWNSLFSLSLSRPRVVSQRCWCGGEETKAPSARWQRPSGSTVPLALEEEEEGKVSLSTTIPPPPPPSKLPLTSPGSLVRHFLQTAVPLHTHSHPPHNSLYPSALAALQKKWMGWAKWRLLGEGCPSSACLANLF